MTRDCPICGERANQVFEVGGLKLDRRTCIVTWQGQPINVPLARFEILEVMMADPDRLWTAAQILDVIDPAGMLEIQASAIKERVKRLREDLSGVEVAVKNRMGFGYWIEPVQTEGPQA